MTKLDKSITMMKGTTAIPRQNGEPVFTSPWESRAFGMVVALCNQGKYPWNDFKERLIAEIEVADGKQEQIAEAEFHYYEYWSTAFEKLLVTKGVLTEAEIQARKAEFKSGERQDVF